MSLLSPVATASCRQIIATERKQKPGVSFSFAAMKLSTALFAPAFGILVGLPALLADEPAAPAPPPDSRYGLFNQLDHRSSYAQDVFPEPFLVDDSAAEDDEARLDWLHTTADASKSDVITAEVEKGFGLLTLEIEVPYERDVQGGDVSQGVGNIDLGARYQNLALARANAMPAVLLEVGFMINPDEFASLIDPQFQSSIAESIARGIKEYFYAHRGERDEPRQR